MIDEHEKFLIECKIADSFFRIQQLGTAIGAIAPLKNTEQTISGYIAEISAHCDIITQLREELKRLDG